MRGDSSGAETAVTLRETKREKETKFRKEGARSREAGRDGRRKGDRE